MGLIELIIVLVVIGLAFWAVNTLAPALKLPPVVVTIINVVLVVIVVIFLLKVLLGVVGFNPRIGV
jgi:hypothetical protein